MNHPYRIKSIVAAVTFIIIVIGIAYIFHITTQSSRSSVYISEDPGKKVVVHLPSGQRVYTFENYLFEKEGHLYYENNDITIDLENGEIVFEEWKE